MKAEKAEAKATKKSAKKAKAPAAKKAAKKASREAGEEVRAEEEGEVSMSLDLHQVIVQPLVTEKSSAATSCRRPIRSRCIPTAIKHQIREALEKLFDVKVTDVRTMQMRAASRGHPSARTRGTTARWKKAIVTLARRQTHRRSSRGLTWAFANSSR